MYLTGNFTVYTRKDEHSYKLEGDSDEITTVIMDGLHNNGGWHVEESIEEVNRMINEQLNKESYSLGKVKSRSFKDWDDLPYQIWMTNEKENTMNTYKVGVTIYNSFAIEADTPEEAIQIVRNYSCVDILDDNFNITDIDLEEENYKC